MIRDIFVSSSKRELSVQYQNQMNVKLVDSQPDKSHFHFVEICSSDVMIMARYSFA